MASRRGITTAVCTTYILVLLGTRAVAMRDHEACAARIMEAAARIDEMEAMRGVLEAAPKVGSDAELSSAREKIARARSAIEDARTVCGDLPDFLSLARKATETLDALDANMRGLSKSLTDEACAAKLAKFEEAMRVLDPPKDGSDAELSRVREGMARVRSAIEEARPVCRDDAGFPPLVKQTTESLDTLDAMIRALTKPPTDQLCQQVTTAFNAAMKALLGAMEERQEVKLTREQKADLVRDARSGGERVKFYCDDNTSELQELFRLLDEADTALKAAAP